MKILIIDGSLGGRSGNTAQALLAFAQKVGPRAEITTVHLATDPAPTREAFVDSDAFVFSSGTYWDSWGSPLQKFFEDVTKLEGDTCWLGKPAALITTMHSVGGKDILNRLHGVLTSFGLFIPPMCGFTYSFANHLALQNSTNCEDAFVDDLWSLDDIETLAENLVTAMHFAKDIRSKWQAWPVDNENPNRQWLRT